jgi:two-component system, cell cycle response regulator CpdR
MGMMANIILAEDDVAVRGFVTKALERQGHTVEAFENGEDALENLCEGHSYDLLLSDIRMPLMDGISLAKASARLNPDMPIVLMTGYADQREGAKEITGLVYDVIPKPFAMQTVLQTVRDALAGAGAKVLA